MAIIKAVVIGDEFYRNLTEADIYLQVRQHVETIKAEVRNTIERYVKELKDRQMLLNSEVETFQQSELRNLRSEMFIYFFDLVKLYIITDVYTHT